MIKKMILGAMALGIFATSCSNDDDATVVAATTSPLTIDFTGLEELGSDFVYEGWVIVDGSPVSTGTFSSVVFPQTFQVDTQQLSDATTFVLSIEPTIDPDPLPAETKILAGDFLGDSAAVNSNLVADFSEVTGAFILATPTDMDDTNESSGVWFLDNSSGMSTTGLILPELSEGWKYEGWAVIDGTPVSTGTFIDASMADDNAATSPFKGDAGNGPAYPGEDFLQNAPEGMMFPTDLKGQTIVVSVEPSPDNDLAPFTLKPLAHMIPSDAMEHTTITMGEGPITSLVGSVTR